MTWSGVLNILKPPGMTSHDVVAAVRRFLPGTRAGHTGTLDPWAAGVLPVCLGRATRLARFITGERKEYLALALLGQATDSGDTFGHVLGRQAADEVTREALTQVLAGFTGRLWQIPPMTSAVKKDGRPLYALAHQGLSVDREARPVAVYSLRLLETQGLGGPRPMALLQVACSKGTYIRTLVHDAGAALGCGACLAFLLRTAVGPYRLEKSLTLEELGNRVQSDRVAGVMVSMDTALAAFPVVNASAGAARAVASGAVLYPPGVVAAPPGLARGQVVRLHGPRGLVAVAETVVEESPAGARTVFRPLAVLV